MSHINLFCIIGMNYIWKAFCMAYYNIDLSQELL